MKTLFIVITLTFAMVMPIISSIATSAFSSAASSSSSLLLSPSKLSAAQAPVQASGSRSSPPLPSPSLPLTMIRFDTNTTIKDILAIHNLGIPFDKFIAKVSAVAKGQNATVSQIRAWNYIQSLVKINTDVCNNLNQQQGVNSNKDVGNIMMSSFLSLPPPPKAICDSKMSFAYEVCKGDPTISDCSATIRKYPSEAINNYIKTKNMHDGTQTDNLAYEELENISVSLNHIPNNTIANVVHFGSSEIAATKS